MAKPVDIAYQAITSTTTGFICGYSPVIIPSAYTDWLMAGGIGIAGMFGAVMGRGAVERIGLGAVDGATSFMGFKMAMLLKNATAQPTVTPAPVPAPTTFAQPKLVSIETAKANKTSFPKTTSKKSVIEI